MGKWISASPLSTSGHEDIREFGEEIAKLEKYTAMLTHVAASDYAALIEPTILRKVEMCCQRSPNV